MASPMIKRLLLQRRRAADVTAFSLVSDALQSASMAGGSRMGYTRLGIRYVTAVNVTEGKQYLMGFDLQTGAIVSKTLVCSRYTAQLDDHNTGDDSDMPNGTDAVIYNSSHSAANEIAIREVTGGDPANLGTEVLISNARSPGLVTYPYAMETPEVAQPHGLCRVDQQYWYMFRKSGTWQFYSNPFWADTDQTYCYAKKIGTNLYLMHAARNSNNDAKLYSFTVNVSNGAIKNAAGTTIANFFTGSPAISANPASADVWLDPGAGWSASPGNWFPDGLSKYYTRGDSDNQYEELWVATCDDVANLADPAHWTHVNVATANRLGPTGYGVGSTTATPFSSTARPRHIDFGDGVRRLLYTQILGGVCYNSIIEEVSAGVWRSVLPINESAQNTDHYEYAGWLLGGAGNKAKVILRCEDHANFDDIINGVMKVVVIDNVGSVAPAITAASSYSVDEYCDWQRAISTDSPAGIYISGGADADKFEIVGGKYLRLLRAANYDAPHDADANNQFDVQVKARALCGLESAALNITLTITALTKTGGANLFLQTANVTNAAWTKTGINNGSGSGQTNSPDVLDAAGGNTMNKLTQSAVSARHRAGQSRTHTANAEHSVRYEAQKNAGCHYATIQPGFGTGNGSLTATFDLVRGRYVGAAPASAGPSPSRTWCVPLANGNFDIGVTYNAPATTGSGEVAIIVRQFSGPLGTETGSTTASLYFRNPMQNTGKYKNYVVRTT